MPPQRPYAEFLEWVVRVRWGAIVLLAVLIAAMARTPGALDLVGAWELLLFSALLNVAYAALVRVPAAAPFLLFTVFLVDGGLVSLWVLFSGGEVSFYLPLYLPILVAAVFVFPPRAAALFSLLFLALLWAVFTFHFYYGSQISVPPENLNPVAAAVANLPVEDRRGIYLRQGLRWSSFFLLTIFVGGYLSHRFWRREDRIRQFQRNLESQRHLLQLGELAGRLAHGVNTPLGLLSGHLELLLARTPKRSALRATLERLDGYVQRAIRTVHAALDYHRKTLSEVRPVRVADVVQAAVEAVQERLKRSGGKLILDLQPDLPPLFAYPEGVYQALVNLFENALDSISPGGVVLVSAVFRHHPVRLSPEDRRGHIVLTVQDNGKGIPPAQLRRVFEPFYTTKGFGRGTGLGLSIVKRIMEEHQGEVEVESRPGSGATFTLRFPAVGAAPPPTAPKAVGPQKRGGRRARLSGI